MLSVANSASSRRTNGMLYGNPGFFFKQLVAVLFSSVWAFSFTYGMLKSSTCSLR